LKGPGRRSSALWICGWQRDLIADGAARRACTGGATENASAIGSPAATVIAAAAASRRCTIEVYTAYLSRPWRDFVLLDRVHFRGVRIRVSIGRNVVFSGGWRPGLCHARCAGRPVGTLRATLTRRPSGGSARSVNFRRASGQSSYGNAPRSHTPKVGGVYFGGSADHLTGRKLDGFVSGSIFPSVTRDAPDHRCRCAPGCHRRCLLDPRPLGPEDAVGREVRYQVDQPSAVLGAGYGHLASLRARVTVMDLGTRRPASARVPRCLVSWNIVAHVEAKAWGGTGGLPQSARRVPLPRRRGNRARVRPVCVWVELGV
jgi:hypothetical protein